MKKFNLQHAEALYMRFCTIYGDKFFKVYHTDDFKRMWYAEWSTGLKDIDVSLIKDALEHCKLNLEWPPSIAEFIKICEKFSGIPSLEDVMSLAIRRDFNHPIVALVYEKVGSWAISHDKESYLKSKCKEAYGEALNAFRENPERSWDKLKSITDTKKTALMDVKTLPFATKKTDEPIPHWEPSQFTIGNHNFDEKVYNERRHYLLNLDESQASMLCMLDKYDRIRFIRELEGVQSLTKNYSRLVTKKEKNDPRSFNNVIRVFKDWTNNDR